MNGQRSHSAYPLLRLAPCFIVGIIIGEHWSAPVSPWWWAGGAAAFLTIYFLVGMRRSAVQNGALLLAVTALGAALASYDNRQSAPFPGAVTPSERSASAAKEHDIEALVLSQPTTHRATVSYDWLVTRVDGQLLQRPFKLKATLWRDSTAAPSPALAVGSGVGAQAVLEVPGASFSDRRFDYARYLRVKGFRAQAFIVPWQLRPAQVDTRNVSRVELMRLRALVWRARLLQQYRQQGLSGDELGVMAAMTLGDKTSLSSELKQRYAQTGASHVLALSGLHLSILYALLSLFVARSRRVRWLGEGMVIFTLWGYALLAGLSPSLVRATTMLTVLSVCRLLGRQSVSVNTLAFAAMLLLALHPLSLWDVGFQLSFAAVLSIMIYYRPLYALWQPTCKLLRGVWGMLVVSVAAQIGTAPLVAYHFGRLPAYFLLTNFIVVPAAWLLLWGTLLMLLATPWAALSQLLAQAVAMLTAALNAVLAVLAKWPGASIEGIHLSLVQLALVYLAIAALTMALWRLASARRLAVEVNKIVDEEDIQIEGDDKEN